MTELKIDEELKALIPPLRESEYTQLEQNILSEGIREPIITWNGIIIDGHNRYSVAKKHGLNFEVKEMQFDSKDAVIGWMIYNQFGRRNLSAYDRSLLALRLKPIISAKAKKNLITHTSEGYQGCLKSDKAIVDTKKEIAKAAGVGHDTIAKVEKIEQSATPEIKAALKTGKMSINAAYQKITGKKKAPMHKKRVEEVATIDSLKKELALKLEEIEAWKDANAILEARIEYQEERANNAVANYEKTDKKNGGLLEEIADLQEDLDVANANIAKLQEQLEKCKTVTVKKEVPPADYEDLKKEVQTLRERFGL